MAGLVTVTLAYLLFGRGLRQLQPGHIATLTLLEPAVATILGVAVLGESFGMAGVAGCLLLLGAVGLLGASEGREVEPAGDPGLGRGPHGMGEVHGPDC